MATSIDPAELARVLAEIASTTKDPGTAVRLLELVNGLLEAAARANGAGTTDPPGTPG